MDHAARATTQCVTVMVFPRAEHQRDHPFWCLVCSTLTQVLRYIYTMKIYRGIMILMYVCETALVLQVEEGGCEGETRTLKGWERMVGSKI